MRWYWRAAIAVGVGGGASVGLGDEWVGLLSGSCPVDDFFDAIVGRRLTDPVLKGALGFMVACVVFTLLTYLPSGPSDNETRCRKCGYILRGISEPRCPECGERI